MHCTGQTSTQARSFTSMQASVMMAMPDTSHLPVIGKPSSGRNWPAPAPTELAAVLRRGASPDAHLLSRGQGEGEARFPRRAGAADQLRHLRLLQRGPPPAHGKEQVRIAVPAESELAPTLRGPPPERDGHGGHAWAPGAAPAHSRERYRLTQTLAHWPDLL